MPIRLREGWIGFIHKIDCYHLRDAYYLLVDSLTNKYRYVTQQVISHNTYKFKTTQNKIQEELKRQSKSAKFGVYWETPKKSLFVVV
jgi:hypothetical protein